MGAFWMASGRLEGLEFGGRETCYGFYERGAMIRVRYIATNARRMLRHRMCPNYNCQPDHPRWLLPGITQPPRFGIATV